MVLRSSIKAIQVSLEHLRATGDTMGILDRMVTMEERGRVTQKPFYDELERKFAAAHEIASPEPILKVTS